MMLMRLVPVRRAAIAALLALFAIAPLQVRADDARAAYEREDYETAAKLYRTRAEAGDAEAQYRMGMMLRFGWGVDKDIDGAVKQLRGAADRQHPQAQAELGTLYRLGRGVKEDPVEAARLLRAAAAAGVGMAQLSIGRMYRDGIGVPKDVVEAYAWLTAAANNNVMDGLAHRAEIAKAMNEQQLAEANKLAAGRSKKETDIK